WSRRYQAHVEISRRGEELAREAASRFKHAEKEPRARGHLVWLAAAARDNAVVMPLLTFAARDPESALRLQAVRALDEFKSAETPADLFLTALNDADPQVQHAAVVAAFRKFDTVPEAIISGPARSTDTYIRQAATLLMADKANVDQLGNMLQSG